MLFFLVSPVLLADGLEFRLTVSGKILLGLAYRHQIDANTAVRLGSYLGLSGAPVGFHLGMVQDISPIHRWTPFFELGADMLIFHQQDKIAQKIYPSSSVGFTYCPSSNLKHSAELWIGYFSGHIRPVGLSYVHFNSIQ